VYTTIYANGPIQSQLASDSQNAFQLYPIGGVYPFFIDALGNTTTQRLTAKGGFTGGTGSFQNLSATNLTASGAGSFNGTLTAGATGTFNGGITTTSISASDVNANSVVSAAVTAKSSGFLATNNGGFNVFNGSTFPFRANGSGAVTCTSISSTGTGSFGPVGASQLAVSGAISASSIQASNITLNSTPLFNPAYLRAVLSSSGVAANATVNLSWNQGTSSSINIVNAPGFRIVCPDVGIYVFSGKLNANVAITSNKVAILRQSSDGGANWTVLQEWRCGSAPANSDFVLSGYLINTPVANTSFSVQFANDTASSFTFNNNSLYSHLSIWRIA
jgi:hypothetical protein